MPKQLMTAAAVISIVIAAVSCGSKGDRTELSVSIPVDAPDIYTTMTIDIPGKDSGQAWRLKTDSGASIPTQRLSTSDGMKLGVLVNPATLGTGTLMIVPGPESDRGATPFLFSDREGKYLDLTEYGQPVLSYIYGMHLADGVPEDRRRANYIHPLYGLDGEIVTDDFPADHYHHRGLFFAWPTVVVDGDSLDLWHINGIEKRFEEWLVQETGPVFARFGLKNGWYTANRKAVQETMYATVYRKARAGRIIDIELTLEALASDVYLSGSRDPKGYGGSNFRPAPFTDEIITTGAGEQDDSDLKIFPWADFSAIFESGFRPSGVSIFQHPDNPDTPNGWCLRHYGFLGVSWPGKDLFRLRTGKPLTLRYRIWIHRGYAAEGMPAEAYRMYVEPMEAD